MVLKFTSLTRRSVDPLGELELVGALVVESSGPYLEVGKNRLILL